MSLKPTLLLALCPESSFPFPHPATWTKLRHAERTSIFTQRPAPPTAVTAQTPFRTAVRERRPFPSSELWRKDTNIPSDPSQSSEKQRYHLHSNCDRMSACQMPRYSYQSVLSLSICLLYCAFWYWSADFWTVCLMTHCCVWFKSPAAMWELLSYAWTQSLFSWFYHSLY